MVIALSMVYKGQVIRGGRQGFFWNKVVKPHNGPSAVLVLIAIGNNVEQFLWFWYKWIPGVQLVVTGLPVGQWKLKKLFGDRGSVRLNHWKSPKKKFWGQRILEIPSKINLGAEDPAKFYIVVASMDPLPPTFWVQRIGRSSVPKMSTPVLKDSTGSSAPKKIFHATNHMLTIRLRRW